MPIEFPSAPPEVAAPGPYEQYGPPPSSALWRRAKHTASVVVSATVGLACYDAVAVPSPIAESRVYSFAELHPNVPLPTGIKREPALDPKTRELVDNWLNDPTSTRLIDAHRNGVDALSDRSIDPDEQTRRQDQEVFRMRQSIAARYGVTIFDASDTLYLMRKGVKKTKEVPFADYLGAANTYVAQFGVRIEYDDTIKYEDGLHARPRSERGAAKDRLAIQSIVQAFSNLPREYVRDAGLKRLLLTASKPNTDTDTSAYIYPGLDGPTGAAIVYNTDTSISPQTTWHELWHRWNYLFSGGNTRNDPYFALLTNGARYGGIDDNTVAARKQGFYTLNEFYDTFEQVSDEFNARIKKSGSDCYAAAAGAAARLQTVGGMTVFATEYAGQDNISEHKADTAMHIPDGVSYKLMLSEWMPLIAAQFKTELARLASYRPAIAAYFIGVGKLYDFDFRAERRTFFDEQCALILGGVAVK